MRLPRPLAGFGRSRDGRHLDTVIPTSACRCPLRVPLLAVRALFAPSPGEAAQHSIIVVTAQLVHRIAADRSAHSRSFPDDIYQVAASLSPQPRKELIDSLRCPCADRLDVE